MIVGFAHSVPELGRSAPTVLRAHGELVRARNKSTASTRQHQTSTSVTSFSGPSADLGDSSSASEVLTLATDAYLHARARATGATSSRAIAYGYAAGIGVLVALLPLMAWLSPPPEAPHDGGDDDGHGHGHGYADGTWPLRVAVALSGLWWLAGTALVAVWLRPPRDQTRSMAKDDRTMSCGAAIARGWTGLGQMLGEWRRLPQTFVFLGAWFLLSDCESLRFPKLGAEQEGKTTTRMPSPPPC